LPSSPGVVHVRVTESVDTLLTARSPTAAGGVVSGVGSPTKNGDRVVTFPQMMLFTVSTGRVVISSQTAPFQWKSLRLFSLVTPDSS